MSPCLEQFSMRNAHKTDFSVRWSPKLRGGVTARPRSRLVGYLRVSGRIYALWSRMMMVVMTVLMVCALWSCTIIVYAPWSRMMVVSTRFIIMHCRAA